MCANKELFDKYKPYVAGHVVMANGSRSKVSGMSTIKMKMFDRVVRILSYVRYILNLKEKFGFVE